MGYTGSVDLVSGIRPKNNGNFPLVDAKDVRVNDSTRLDAALENIAVEATKAVRYDAAQTLTDAQKQQARENIGAGEVDDTLSVEGMAADAKKTGDEISALKDSLNEGFERLDSIDGIVVPVMELGTIAMSSSSITFNTANNTIRTPENSPITIAEGDVISITDYSKAKFRYCIRKEDGKYIYTNAYLETDYIIQNSGLLYLLVRKTDDSVINDVASLRELVRVSRKTGEIYNLKTTINDLVDDTLTIPGKAADAKVTGDSKTRFNAEITSLKDRLSNIDGITPITNMELGTIAMSSSSITFNTANNIIRTRQNEEIDVVPGDTIHLSDYSIAQYRYAILNNETNKYSYTTVYLTEDYRVTVSGKLWLVVQYTDGREVSDVSTLEQYVYIVRTTDALSTVNTRLNALETVDSINDSKTISANFFGPGTYGSGVYNPTFRTYRFSTKQTLTFDLYVRADNGYRFSCYQYTDGEWSGGAWITNAEIKAGTPFGLLLAHIASDEDTTVTATAEEFLPHFAFNTKLTNRMDTLDERVTALEGNVTVDYAKISEFMSRFYTSDKAEGYAFFTDPHLMGSAGTFDEDTFNSYFDVLSETVKQTSVAYVVCGGDWLNREDTPNQASVKLGYIDGKMRSLFPGRFYNIAGNHDFNYIGYQDGARLPESQWVSNSALHNFWFHDHENCYYSFKTGVARNYVLNTRTDYDGTSSYDKTQLDWLAQSLINDDPDHATIMMHIYYIDSAQTTIPTRVHAIGRIIESYNNHTLCTLTNTDDGYDKTYDFNGKTGHIDYTIVGHLHTDFSDTFGGVPLVGVTNFTHDNTPSFDLVFADYTGHVLYTTRFGSGESRQFII